MAEIVETQAFSQFTLSRYLRAPENDYEILFFDEVVREKVNRRLRFTKAIPSFLTDKSFRVNISISALKPELRDPEEVACTLDQWPVSLDLSKFGSARAVQSLTTDSDESMLRSHTNQILQRSRMNQVFIISSHCFFNILYRNDDKICLNG
jgi:hypothetical protein